MPRVVEAILTTCTALAGIHDADSRELVHIALGLSSPLADVVDTWVELASVMSARDITTFDSGTRCSLGHGTAGVGYVLGMIANARDDASLRDSSRRWFAVSRRLRTRKRAGSVMFGSLGVPVSRALATRSPRATTEAVAALTASTTGGSEFMMGLAGRAFAALSLPHRSRPLLQTIARRLAMHPALADLGFAHGNAGLVAARIALAQALGTAVDDSALAWLRGFDPARVLAEATQRRRGWCNGLSGFVFAWVLAAEADETCRAHAIAAGPHLLDELDEDGGSLCCGLGGRAYALLAIARLDPAGPWIDHARVLATRGLQHELWAGGILQRLPGLVLLAHELQEPARARFPLVET